MVPNSLSYVFVCDVCVSKHPKKLPVAGSFG